MNLHAHHVNRHNERAKIRGRTSGERDGLQIGILQIAIDNTAISS